MLKENNNLDVVNAGLSDVNKIRIYSENVDNKQQNINISNVEDLEKKFETTKTNILPSITNAYGDPCINPNFGDISNKIQETNTPTCTHAHAHNENGESHQDDYDEGYYDLGDNCNPDIVIPEIVCPNNYTCTLGGDDPKQPGGGENNDPGEDHLG